MAGGMKRRLTGCHLGSLHDRALVKDHAPSMSLLGSRFGCC